MNERKREKAREEVSEKQKHSRKTRRKRERERERVQLCELLLFFSEKELENAELESLFLRNVSPSFPFSLSPSFVKKERKRSLP